MAEPDWFDRNEAQWRALETTMQIGEIKDIWVSNKKGVSNLLYALRLSKKEFRFFDTEQEAKDHRMLRGLNPPEPRNKPHLMMQPGITIKL
jgi:hypothetical protein